MIRWLAFTIVATTVLQFGGFQSKSWGEGFDHTQLQSQLQATIKRVLPTTVSITERRRNGFGSFSGVIVTAEGHVLSAAHTVTPDANYEVELTDGRRYQAKGLGVCGEADLGMIKITDSASWPFAQMGDSSAIAVNQPCVSISHPGTYHRQRGAVVRFGRVVQPITSRLGMIQTTAMMEPGDSGGPLFDLEGRVIGIHSQIQQSLVENFEVPVNSFKLFWDQLNKPERFTIDRVPGLPSLGFSGRRNRQSNGVRIVEVNEGGSAELAGLVVDDLITALDGKDVTSSRVLTAQLIARYLEGEREFELGIQRQEKPQKIALKLAEPVEGNHESTVVASGLRTIAAQPIRELENLPREFSALESQLDDTTLKLVSKRGSQSSTILATRIAGTKLAISKSSCVFDNPKMVLHDETALDAEVVARDDANDLVLLRAAFNDKAGVNLLANLPKIVGDELGILLISPDPDGDGLVSVLGSRPFESQRVDSRGYLGVQLDTVEKRVVIMEIVRQGAASRIGLKEGDVVLSIDKLEVSEHQEVRNYLSRQLPDQEVTIVIERDGEKLEKVATLGAPASARHVAEAFDGGKSLRRDGFSQVFCHDAALEPAGCGGPVFDASGRILGINIARYSRTLCFAIPPNVLKQFVDAAGKSVRLESN